MRPIDLSAARLTSTPWMRAECAALYAQRCLEAAAVHDEVAVQHPQLAHPWDGKT